MSALIEPTDPRPVGVARIVVGVAALIKAVVILPILLRLAEPDRMRAPVLDWMPDPSVGLAYALVAVWCLAAVGFTLGWRTTLTGSALAAAIVFALLFDMQSYSNHLYLMAWVVLLLVVADAGAGLSVRGRPRPVARWTVLLLMLQTSIVYFFSAVTKLNPDFLSGQVLAGSLAGGLVTMPESLRTPGFLGPLAISAVLAEAFLAFGLWSPRLRKIAYLVGLGLHASITLLMTDTVELLVFSLLMFATYPLFASVQDATSERPIESPATA